MPSLINYKSLQIISPVPTALGAVGLNNNFKSIADFIEQGVTFTGSQTLTNKTIAAGSNTITGIANANIASGAAIDAAKIANGAVSNTEFQYLDGVTSGIQTQLNAKAAASALANYLPLSGGTVSGTITATDFVGDGSGLTGLSGAWKDPVIVVATTPIDLDANSIKPIGGVLVNNSLPWGMIVVNSTAGMNGDGILSIGGATSSFASFGITGSEDEATMAGLIAAGLSGAYAPYDTAVAIGNTVIIYEVQTEGSFGRAIALYYVSPGEFVLTDIAETRPIGNDIRVLLTAQTEAADNGIYIWTDTAGVGTFARSDDADTWDGFIDAVAYVTDGTFAGTTWRCHNNSDTAGTLDATDIVFTQVPPETVDVWTTAEDGISYTGTATASAFVGDGAGLTNVLHSIPSLAQVLTVSDDAHSQTITNMPTLEVVKYTLTSPTLEGSEGQLDPLPAIGTTIDIGGAPVLYDGSVAINITDGLRTIQVSPTAYWTGDPGVINYYVAETSIDLDGSTGTATATAFSVNGEYTFPTTDGTASQILTTDGAGAVSWETLGPVTPLSPAPFRGDYISEGDYPEGDVVRSTGDFDGTRYFQKIDDSILSGVGPANTDYWQYLPNFVDYISGAGDYNLSLVGEWATAIDYIANDVVTLGGRSFACILAHNSTDHDTTEPTYWTSLSPADTNTAFPLWDTLTLSESAGGKDIENVETIEIVTVTQRDEDFTPGDNTLAFTPIEGSVFQYDYDNTFANNWSFIYRAAGCNDGIGHGAYIAITGTAIHTENVNVSVRYQSATPFVTIDGTTGTVTGGGIVKNQGAWTADTDYEVNDQVTKERATWLCVQAHNSDSFNVNNPAYWQLVGMEPCTGNFAGSDWQGFSLIDGRLGWAADEPTAVGSIITGCLVVYVASFGWKNTLTGAAATGT